MSESFEQPDREQWVSASQWRRTYQHAYALTRNPTDAEDIAQEAYLQLYEWTLTGRKIDSYRAWMKGVVRHIVYQLFRKTRPDLHIAIDTDNSDQRSIIDSLADPSASLEEWLVDESLMRESLRVLLELPDLDRECVMMYVRGYTFVQIANALGLSYKVALGTTKRALLKTRCRIGVGSK